MDARTVRRLTLPVRGRCPTLSLLLAITTACGAQTGVAGSTPLSGESDRSAEMVAGLHRFLDREQPRLLAARGTRWQVDLRDRAAYEASVAPNRARLAGMLGVMDDRVSPVELRLVASPAHPSEIARCERFTVQAVRWGVLDRVEAEGLWLRPHGAVRARVVALPDADQAPEVLVGLVPGLSSAHQWARRLAENGCEVLIPVLVDRADTYSGNPALNRHTNQPHREWIYRQAFALGRHPIGYEIQTVLAAVDWLTGPAAGEARPVAVAGWGEGGLLALASAALDPRIAVAAVSGYFGPRDQLADEPIYRNVFGYLREFGDAELARLIVPRRLLIEAAPGPRVDGPPAPRAGASGAAPGRLTTPPLEAVKAEIARARRLAGPWAEAIELAEPSATAGDREAFGRHALGRLLQLLGGSDAALLPAGPEPPPSPPSPSRQRRLVAEWQGFTQRLIAASRTQRDEFLWNRVSPTGPEAWAEAMRPYRERFRHDIIGELSLPEAKPVVRSRPLRAGATWTADEVVIDLVPDVFAWGYLLRPNSLASGERRPVVVAQHGLEGLPADLLDEDPQSRAFRAYQALAVRLVERGFIVFVPHNPYRGDRFRPLQRRAHPLGLSLFSFITAQHAGILDWLATLPGVDAGRIGFYGLSYGGTTAMRVPALLERYAVVVTSGNFNEWVWKLSTTDWPGSYVFTREYEMPEFSLGPTFGHAEMAALIAPRPFMVERGHADGVGIDEWVAFEYARVRRLYDRLGVPGRTAIEYFDGPHRIHGVGTLAFLHRHLRWPEPTATR